MPNLPLALASASRSKATEPNGNVAAVASKEAAVIVKHHQKKP
jgi:hypothetical protein